MFEELNPKVDSENKRINQILEILLKYTQHDFSNPIPISEKSDALDTIAVGLNMMADELQAYISEQKEAQHKINKLNEELEQKVIKRTAELENKILQLKESEEKFQKAFQASAAAISITRLSDSTYMDVNDTFIKMTGYSKQELIGHTSVELGLVVTHKKREEVLQLIREQGWAKDFELSLRKKTGEISEILSSVETILLNGEKYALNIIYDITERKKMELQLESANKELEAFSYSVSHDLKAPLRAINGHANIIYEEHEKILDEGGKHALKSIISNAKRMATLIENLLELSRLGRKEIVTQEIDMKELVDKVLHDMVDPIGNSTEIIVHKLYSIKGDYVLIYQVIVNLISNAVKYSSKKEHPSVTIASEECGSEIVFSVKDNGTGFDMQYVDKLFGVFQRLHSQTEFEGTGIGLAIIRRIVTKHGGKTWAEGRENEGSTFYFSVPKS